MADGGHQRRADALGGDVVHALGQEGLDQHGAGGSLRDAPGAQVEERAVVEVAGGGAMAADDVVGIDLQFRLGVDLGLVGQQQHLAELVAVGVLGIAMDDDLALEHRARGVVDRSEEHTSALQSLMRISYAVFCLKKKKKLTIY